jgi:hypothetical protein
MLDHPGYNPHRYERIASEVKEIIVKAYRMDIENLLPNPAKLFF